MKLAEIGKSRFPLLLRQQTSDGTLPACGERDEPVRAALKPIQLDVCILFNRTAKMRRQQKAMMNEAGCSVGRDRRAAPKKRAASKHRTTSSP